jgi:hypothetical protein
VSRGIFFVLKTETMLFMTADRFLAFFLRRKSKIKFLLASLKLLTNSKNPSSNPLQEACSGFLIAACD